MHYFIQHFSLLAMFLQGYLIFLFVKHETTNDDQQLLLLKPDRKQKTLIERWQFSREDTIAIMFCSATKTVAKGVPVDKCYQFYKQSRSCRLIFLAIISLPR